MLKKILFLFFIQIFHFNLFSVESEQKKSDEIDIKIFYIHVKEHKDLQNCDLSKQQCFNIKIKKPGSFPELANQIFLKLEKFQIKIDENHFRLTTDLKNEFLNNQWNIRRYSINIWPFIEKFNNTLYVVCEDRDKYLYAWHGH